MSGAVLFLLVALGAAAVGSFLLWLFSGHRRAAPPDYREQLRAIAPRDGRVHEQPRGIIPIESDTEPANGSSSPPATGESDGAPSAGSAGDAAHGES